MIFEPRLFERSIQLDERGMFSELWSIEHPWKQIGLLPVQENISRSRRNTFRGMHWQLPPMEQGKLVTVLQGSIVDVVLDLRRSKKTFGNTLTFSLDSLESSLWVPPGFAHGFHAVEDGTVVCYQVTKSWSRPHERSIQVRSLTDVFSKLPVDLILSKKDSDAPSFEELLEQDCFE